LGKRVEKPWGAEERELSQKEGQIKHRGDMNMTKTEGSTMRKG